jgi:hypothetical protein
MGRANAHEYLPSLALHAQEHATSGGRIMAARAHERIMTDADFSAQVLLATNG